MPDFGAPVVTAQSAINPIQTLSGILGLQQQQQQLKTATAQATVAQQSAQENQALAGLLKDPVGSGVVDAKGNPTQDYMQKILAVAPTTGAEKASQVVNAAKDGVAFRTSLNSLNEEQRGSVGDIVGAIAARHGSREDYMDALDTAVQQNPGLSRAAISIAAKIPRAPDFKGDGQDSSRASQYQQQLDNFGTSVVNSVRPATVQPSYAGAGDRLVQTNPLAPGGAPSGNISVGAPPGWQFDPVTKTWHPTSALPPGGGGGQPSAPQNPQTDKPAARQTVAGAPQYAPGEAATLEANQQAGAQRYNELVNAAADSPARANVLDNIIRIAGDPNAPRTGPGAGWKAAANTAIGQTPGFQNAKDDATRYNELSKFLHQSALRAWQGAGGTGTNQQLATIEGANPNVTQDPATIVALAKYNKAGELALQAKATAHQNWMHQPGNNFANQGDFEQKWRQNFDPVIFQLGTASPAEQRSIIQNLTPDQARALTEKRAALKALGADVP